MTVKELIHRLNRLGNQDAEVQVLTNFNDSAWFASLDLIEIVDGKVQLSSMK